MRAATFLAVICLATLARAHEAERASIELLARGASSMAHVRVTQRYENTYDITIVAMLTGKGEGTFVYFSMASADDPLRPVDGIPKECLLLWRDYARNRGDFAVVPLHPAHGQAVFSMDRRPLKTRKEIIDAATAAMAYPYVSMGWSAITVRDPDTGREVLLRIPVDRRTVDLARRWAFDPDVQTRLDAALILDDTHDDWSRYTHVVNKASGKNDPLGEDIAIMRTLLNDTGVQMRGEFAGGPRDIYTVRRAAAEALTRWGENVGLIRTDVLPWPLLFAKKHALGFSLAGAMIVCCELLYFAIRRRRVRKGRFVERTRVGRLVFSTLCLISFLLAAAVLHYWRISYNVGAAFERLSPQSRTILCCKYGRILVGRVERKGWKRWQDTADWGEAKSWYISDLRDRAKEEKRLSFAGVVIADAETEGFSAGTLVQIPMWMVFAVSAFLPVVWLLRQRRFAQRRRWADGGCCISCGYDLRHSTERCPECGRDVQR